MKLHPRERIRSEASVEIADVITKHKLTEGEIISIFAVYLSSIAKYMIRGERHNDESKPGGLE